MPKSYSMSDAQHILGLGSRTTVYRYIVAGHLLAQKAPYGLIWKYMVDETELRRFATAHGLPFNLPEDKQPSPKPE